MSLSPNNLTIMVETLGLGLEASGLGLGLEGTGLANIPGILSPPMVDILVAPTVQH